MAPRNDSSVALRCHRDVSAGWSAAGHEGGNERLARVRRRLLLGVYDSDAVVAEVARRMLASGELGWDVRGSDTQQRRQADYRGV